MKLAVCSGSFDPITLGHLDVIQKSATLFDSVIVLVSVNSAKTSLLTTEQRVEALQSAIADLDEATASRIEVHAHSGLLADFVTASGAIAIVRGLRGGADLDAELPMALMNRHLSGVETVFIASDPRHAHISSSLVKDVAKFGGRIEDMLPPRAAELTQAALRESNRTSTGTKQRNRRRDQRSRPEV